MLGVVQHPILAQHCDAESEGVPAGRVGDLVEEALHDECIRRVRGRTPGAARDPACTGIERPSATELPTTGPMNRAVIEATTGAVLIKTGWTFVVSTEAGAMSHLPAAVLGLAVLNAVILYVRHRIRKGSLPKPPQQVSQHGG